MAKLQKSFNVPNAIKAAIKGIKPIAKPVSAKRASLNSASSYAKVKNGR